MHGKFEKKVFTFVLLAVDMISSSVLHNDVADGTATATSASTVVPPYYYWFSIALVVLSD